MKKKKLVIFFLAVVTIYIIYNITYNEKNTYLSIGDDLAKGHTPFDTYSDSYSDYLYNYLKKEDEKLILNRDFIEEDLRIKDLLELIRNPKINKTKNLPQAIRESNIITISIGSEELFSKLRSHNFDESNKKLYSFIDDMLEELEELIKEIKKINNTDIYLIGYYNPIEINEQNETKIKSLFNYIDVKYKVLEERYKVNYISIYEEFKNKAYYLPNKSHAFPSLEGYNYIANEIIKKIEKN